MIRQEYDAQLWAEHRRWPERLTAEREAKLREMLATNWTLNVAGIREILHELDSVRLRLALALDTRGAPAILRASDNSRNTI